jgi:hypothetical protein
MDRQGAIRRILAAGIVLCAAAQTATAAENRCGWLHNPTPGIWWLVDRHASWTLREQGPEDGPDGMDLIPDISERDYRKTNGNYGYACACMTVETNSGQQRITKILSVRQLPLSKCDRDKSLPSE